MRTAAAALAKLAGVRRERPSSSAMKKAAANTSPAPRSSTACCDRRDRERERGVVGLEDRGGPRARGHGDDGPGGAGAGDQLCAAGALVLVDDDRVAAVGDGRCRGEWAASARSARRGRRHSRTSPCGVSPTKPTLPRQSLGLSRATGARCRTAVSSVSCVSIGPAQASMRWLRAEPEPRGQQRRRVRRAAARAARARRGRARSAARSRARRPRVRISVRRPRRAACSAL